MQKSCCRHSTKRVPTKPNKPCDGNNHFVGTSSPYNWYFVGAPTNTSSRD